ncbi:MAG: NAD-dependent epimerase/dehydratase family protein [Rhizomicrobium sp.]
MDLTSFFAGRSVCITGGAGFIGSHLSRSLVQLGADVRIVDNLERGSRRAVADILNHAELVVEDLRDKETCPRNFRDREIVVHLASKVGGIRYYLEKPYEVFEANSAIDGNVLNAAIAARTPHFFYASSAHVYPIELQMSADAPEIVEEQAIPAHPELSYGWAKLIGEKRIEYAIAEGLPLRAAVARIIGAYGPGQDYDLDKGSAIPVFIRRAIEYPKRAPFTVMGMGKETRSYCYIDDIVDGILRSICKTQSQTLVGPYNLGRSGRNTIAEIAEAVIAISGKDIPIAWQPSAATVIWGQALDCSHATALLESWQPRVELREGLRRCYDDIARRMAEQ